ncbi:hypothetical protein GCM10020220_070250 [Nonomuraea rubra]|uniref:hypothetical protein n=1 Tax=Nonomuraea rubra TaxID=46180 RepID=UPI0031E7C56F
MVCALAPEIGTLLPRTLVLAAFAALLTVLTTVLAVSGEGQGTVPGTNRNAVPITVRTPCQPGPQRRVQPRVGGARPGGGACGRRGGGACGAVELGARAASGKAGGARDGSVGGLAVAAVCATLGGFAGAAAGGGL